MIERTLVIGNSACAHRIVSLLLAGGHRVIQAAQTDRFSVPDAEYSGFKHLERLANATIDRCEGHVGNFRITATRNGARLERTAGTVVIAEESIRQSNIDLYGLSGRPSVYPVSEISNRIANGAKDDSLDRLHGKRIVFLIGLLKEVHPVSFAEAMRAAHRLQTGGGRICIFSKNLKVAGNGLEESVREFKQAGGLVFKFSEKLPRFTIEPGHPVRIDFTDEVTREAQSIRPDILVVDETLYPSPGLERLSRIFGLDTDSEGFLQTGNPHRLIVMTNRRGILAAGPSRSVQTEEQEEADAHAAAVTALTLAAFPAAGEAAGKAEIDPARCIRCLTCFRLCPHRAVSFTAKVTVAAEACEGCGICASECPRGAIRLSDSDPAETINRISLAGARSKDPASAPFLVAFCCRQSAALAAAQASAAGQPLPENLLTVSVPCAGSISMDLLLASFRFGAEGVLVLTCHEGNCRSEQGNRFAGDRAGRIRTILSEVGLDPERIGIDSLAANMGSDFARRAARFEQKIKGLG